jgi:hypothetical protein
MAYSFTLRWLNYSTDLQKNPEEILAKIRSKKKLPLKKGRLLQN